MRKLKKKINLIKKEARWCVVLVLAVILVSLGVNTARAEWREPDLPPPQESFYMPLTSDAMNQTKSGYLLLDEEGYNPTEDTSLTFFPLKPLDVRGYGAQFYTPNVFSDILSVGTDTLYANSNLGRVGINTLPFQFGTPVYKYRKRLTFNAASLSAPVSDFPVMVYADSTFTDFWPYVQSTDGYDVVFTDKDNNLLTHHFEKFDFSGQEMVAWVKIPDLQNNNTDYIYMYYGQDGPWVDLQDEAGTYDANYIMVQHLEESPGNGVAGHLNSVSASHTGTPQNFSGLGGATDASGQIDGADLFEGDDDYVDIPYDDALVPGSITMSAWVKFNDISGANWQAVISRAGANDAYNILLKDDVDKIRFYVKKALGGDPSCGANWSCIEWSTAVNTTDWYSFTLTHDATTGKLEGFVNGASVGSETVNAAVLNPVSNINIGQYAGGSNMNGYIDEVVISNTVRSDDWITATYLSESNTLFSYGSKQDYRLARLQIEGGTVQAGTDLAPITGRAVSAYSNSIGIYSDVGSIGQAGVYGLSSEANSLAVKGSSDANKGVQGESSAGVGIYATSASQSQAAVYAANDGGGWAGYFNGRLGAVADVIAKTFLPTALQKSLIPFTSGQEVASYNFGSWSTFPGNVFTAFDGGYIWATATDLDDNNHNLFKIRASDGQAIESFNVADARLFGIVYDGIYLWLGDLTGAIYRFNPADGSYASVSGLSADVKFSMTASEINGEIYIWAIDAAADDILKIKAADLSVEVFDLPTLMPGTSGANDLAFDGTYLWVTAISGHIVRIYAADPNDSGHPPVNWSTAGELYENIYFDGLYIWGFSSSTATQILKLHPDNHPTDAGYNPNITLEYYGIVANREEMVFDGTYLWIVGNEGAAHKLYRHLAADPSKVTAFDLAYDPLRLTFDGTYLWLPEDGSAAALHKYYSGTGLGQADLNSVVNLRNNIGQCSVTGGECIYDWDCPGGTRVEFGVDGNIDTALGSLPIASDIHIDTENMYVFGTDSNSDWRIEKRRLRDGALDVNFGINGSVTSDTSSTFLYQAAVDSNYMYSVGTNTSGHWRIEKRDLITGDLITDFGTGGIVDGDVLSLNAMSVAIDSSYMYVVGNDVDTDGAGSLDSRDWRIEKRDLVNGDLVAAFGVNGVVTSGLDIIHDGANAIAIDDSYMYVGGMRDDINPYWAIEKRDLITGDLITDFGTGGIVAGDPSTDSVKDLVIDSDYMYIIGMDDTPDWRYEKRDLITGDLITDFGIGGVITGEPATKSPEDIMIDSEYFFTTGYNEDNEWRYEKRDLNTGGLVSGFGANGVVLGGVFYPAPSALSGDPSYLYMVSNMFNSWRISKRYKSTGLLVGSETCDAGNPVQSGSINISGRAEVSNGYCYTTDGGGTFYYSRQCVADADCSDLTNGQCLGGDAWAGGNVTVESNLWGGSDQTVSVSGNSAVCPSGLFVKGITLDANGEITEIICREL